MEDTDDATVDAALAAMNGVAVDELRRRYGTLLPTVRRLVLVGIRAAVLAEREACAALCDRWSDTWRPDVPALDRYADGLASGAEELADAIRGRTDSRDAAKEG